MPAVGAGRLGAAAGSAAAGWSGCAVVYMGAYAGAVAVADVFAGCGAVVVADSVVVAGSGWGFEACVLSSLWLELRGAEVYVGIPVGADILTGAEEISE